MSLGAVRLGDFVSSYCPNIPSGPFYSASTDTFVNARGQVRLADSSVPGVATTGSTTHFVNGRPAVRMVDLVVCGIISTASTDTFIA